MSTANIRFALVCCCLIALLVGITSCDTVDSLVESPPDIEPPVIKTDTTYDRANLTYSPIEGYGGGITDGKWGFFPRGGRVNQPGYTSVLEWTGQQWKHVQDLPFKDEYVSFEGNRDFYATLGTRARKMSISGDRAILHAYAQYHDASHVDYWKGNAIIFAWNGSEWVEEANLFEDDPLDLNSDVYSASMGKDIALVFITGMGIEGDSQVLAFRWTGHTWEKTVVEGVRGSGEVVGEQLFIREHIRGSDFLIVFEWDGVAWARVQEITIPRKFGRPLAQDQDFVFFAGEYAVDADKVFSLERRGASWMEGPVLTQENDSLSFGSSIATDGEFLAVGAESGNSSICSVVYLYERVLNEWVAVDTFKAPVGENHCSSFGRELSMSDRLLLVTGSSALHSYSW